MSVHGTSMVKFIQKMKSETPTVLILEDEMGFKFGAFCLEEWVHR
jgi:hypothetical protein